MEITIFLSLAMFAYYLWVIACYYRNALARTFGAKKTTSLNTGAFCESALAQASLRSPIKQSEEQDPLAELALQIRRYISPCLEDKRLWDSYRQGAWVLIDEFMKANPEESSEKALAQVEQQLTGLGLTLGDRKRQLE